MKIYCLFSVDNEYSQPPCNLVAAWKTKPSLGSIGHALNVPFPNDSDSLTIDIVHIWNGKEVKINDTEYRIEKFQLLD